MACVPDEKTASTPSPSVTPSMSSPLHSRTARRSVRSNSPAFATYAASPRRSVSAVESTMSVNRITAVSAPTGGRSEEHTSELQSHVNLVCRLLLEKKKIKKQKTKLYTYIKRTPCYIHEC